MISYPLTDNILKGKLVLSCALSAGSKMADFDNFFPQNSSWFRFPVSFCVLSKNLFHIYEIDPEKDVTD